MGSSFFQESFQLVKKKGVPCLFRERPEIVISFLFTEEFCNAFFLLRFRKMSGSWIRQGFFPYNNRKLLLIPFLFKEKVANWLNPPGCRDEVPCAWQSQGMHVSTHFTHLVTNKAASVSSHQKKNETKKTERKVLSSPPNERDPFCPLFPPLLLFCLSFYPLYPFRVFYSNLSSRVQRRFSFF